MASKPNLSSKSLSALQTSGSSSTTRTDRLRVAVFTTVLVHVLCQISGKRSVVAAGCQGCPELRQPPTQHPSSGGSYPGAWDFVAEKPITFQEAYHYSDILEVCRFH